MNNEIKTPEIPKDGWFHDTAMKIVLGQELSEIMKYPLKNGRPFSGEMI